MIDVKVIGSGSSGNCYLVTIKDKKILLEAGLPFKVIQKAMNFKLSEIDACLITHEHKDHSKAVKDLLNHGIDCYMTEGTKDALNLVSHRLKVFKRVGKEYMSTVIDNVKVKPFEAVHDATEPVSFLIESGNESMLFITDTAYIKYKLKPVSLLMIECNYVKEIIDKKVQQGSMNVYLRNRIIKNHMSLETLISFLEQTDTSLIKKIYIMHLSDANSDMHLIKSEVQKRVPVEVAIC